MSAHFTLNILSFVTALVFAFPQIEEVALRQIVLATEQEAREARTSLDAGTPFEALAADRSRDATAARGGYMGRMRLSDIRSEVRNALEPLVPGRVSSPVRIGNTYVLFQIVPEAESRWIDLDEAGAQALTQGRTEDAASRFEQALAQAESGALGDARLARSLDSLADVYRAGGRTVESEKLYRRALVVLERMKAPELEMAQVLSSLGMTLIQQARLNEADGLYARARSIREKILGPDHPEVAAILHNIAESLALQKRFVDAAKFYNQSQVLLERSLGPAHPATVAGAESRDAFRRAVEDELLERCWTAASLSEFRDPMFIAQTRELLPLAGLTEEGYLRLKDILLDGGLNEEAETVLRSGIDRFPNSRILRIYLADLLAATGRTHDALGVLQDTSRLPSPEGTDPAANRQQLAIISQRIGDMHSALSNFDAALVAYGRALEIDPATPDGRVKLGRAYFAIGRLEDAETELELAVRQTPKISETYLTLAEALAATAKWERAAAAAERAIELNVSDPRALYLLGTALVRMGRREQGEEHLREFARVEAGFEEAAQRSRDITAVQIAAAGAYREGDANSALEQLVRGVSRFSNAGRLHMSLAIVQSRLGQHKAAVETLEAMLKLELGLPLMIHKILSEEYALLGSTEASARHRKLYLETREARR